MTDKEVFKEFIKTRPVAYYPDFSIIAGSTTAGVLLSQLFYWTDKGADPDGWIHKKQSEWKNEIALSRYEQESARAKLCKSGVMQEKLKGNPAMLYFRINFDLFYERLKAVYEAKGIEVAEIPQAGKSHAGKPHTSKWESNIVSLAENTAENTGSSDSMPMMPEPFKTKKSTITKKPEIVEIPEIEPIMKIIVDSGMKRTTISANMRTLIHKAVLLHGLEFCERAMRGRVAEAARKGAGLALTAFLDPEAGDWMDRCARVATGPVKVLTMAPSIAETIMDEIEGQWKAAQ